MISDQYPWSLGKPPCPNSSRDPVAPPVPARPPSDPPANTATHRVPQGHRLIAPASWTTVLLYSFSIVITLREKSLPFLGSSDHPNPILSISSISFHPNSNFAPRTANSPGNFPKFFIKNPRDFTFFRFFNSPFSSCILWAFQEMPAKNVD